MRRPPGRRSRFLRSCPRRRCAWARLPLSAVLALFGAVPWFGPALAAIVIAGLATGLVSPVRATDALAASLAASLAFAPSVARAQQEGHAPMVLQLPASARALALADAWSGGRDVDAIFYNPAQLSLSPESQLLPVPKFESITE